MPLPRTIRRFSFDPEAARTIMKGMSETRGKILEELPKWCGLDETFLELLERALLYRNRIEDAEEVFCILREEGCLWYRHEDAPPPPSVDKHYKRLTYAGKIIILANLATKLRPLGSHLTSFLMEEAIELLGKLQIGYELMPRAAMGGDAPSLERLYETVALSIRLGGMGTGEQLWERLLSCCGDIQSQQLRARIRNLLLDLKSQGRFALMRMKRTGGGEDGYEG